MGLARDAVSHRALVGALAQRRRAFCGAQCYPRLSVLYGTHFGGLKPWQIKNRSVAHYAKYPDYQRWYAEYVEMVTQDHPQLLQVRRLQRLLDVVEGWGRESVGALER